MTLTDLAGYTPIETCEWLGGVAGQLSPEQAIVEIGVFKGRSVCYLGDGARRGRGAHVWGVDPWDLPGDRKPYQRPQNRRRKVDFTRPDIRLAAEAAVAEYGLSDQVTLVRGFSAEVAAAWDGPLVGLLYIDGDHTAAGIGGDLDGWLPHCAAEATVVIDDHIPQFPEVVAAVARFVEAGQLKPVDQRGRLAVTGPAGE